MLAHHCMRVVDQGMIGICGTAVGTRLTPLGTTHQGGSHKGYGLSAVMEIVSGMLSGSELMNVAGLGNASHFFMVAVR